MALTRLPPGPKGHYLFGNLPDYRQDPLGFQTRCSQEYGDVVRLRFPGLRHIYLLNHPDHIEHVLVKNSRNFVRSRKRIWHRRESSFLGKGLLNSEGEFWRRQRRLTQPAFHRQRINAYGELMVSYTERMLTIWRDGETRDVHQEMMRLLLPIVAEALFGARIAGKTEDVWKAFEQVAKIFDERGRGVLPRVSRFLRFRKAIRRLDEIVYGLINERRSTGQDTGDLLSMLLHSRDEDGNRMSDKQLRDEVVTMLFGGYETTALALTWTWYLLSQHPEVEAKLHKELKEVLGDRAPTAEDLPRLRYVEMVVKESMRLYPPVWSISREAVGDCEIGGYRVPAGTQLFMAQWVMHRDPRYFEDPELCNPDRWEDKFAKQVPRYAYFPFGGGPRLCIGNTLAITEATLLLATIAKKFQLKLTSEQRVIPQPSITLRPKGGIEMVLIKRSPDT